MKQDVFGLLFVIVSRYIFYREISYGYLCNISAEKQFLTSNNKLQTK